jgi:hypothetical protein
MLALALAALAGTGALVVMVVMVLMMIVIVMFVHKASSLGFFLYYIDIPPFCQTILFPGISPGGACEIGKKRV